MKRKGICNGRCMELIVQVPGAGLHSHNTCHMLLLHLKDKQIISKAVLSQKPSIHCSEEWYYIKEQKTNPSPHLAFYWLKNDQKKNLPGWIAICNIIFFLFWNKSSGECSRLSSAWHQPAGIASSFLCIKPTCQATLIARILWPWFRFGNNGPPHSIFRYLYNT